MEWGSESKKIRKKIRDCFAGVTNILLLEKIIAVANLLIIRG